MSQMEIQHSIRKDLSNQASKAKAGKCISHFSSIVPPLLNPFTTEFFTKLQFTVKKHPEVTVNISNSISIENNLITMTGRFRFLTIIVFAILLTGCSKTPDVIETPEAKLARLLTGIGNKYWHLNKIFINAVPQALTSAQLAYTKTYTINPAIENSGVFTNSDGITGKWKIASAITFYESFVSGGGAGIQLDYTVIDITETTMDVQYKSNNKIVEEVYYAY